MATASTNQPDGKCGNVDVSVVVAILRFRSDGTTERLEEVNVERHDHVQLYDVPTLGNVLVLGEPDSTSLRAELDRIAGTPTAVGQA